jgi:MFS superfamily sulfate permease-like transporter
MTITRWLPGLATLKAYKASFLPHDLAAGLTLGAVMVPVGLARPGRSPVLWTVAAAHGVAYS